MDEMDSAEFELLRDAAHNLSSNADTERSITTGYVTLRKMLKGTSLDDEKEFRKKFSSYYGLNRWVTEEWKNKYFELLFSFRKKIPDEPHERALRELFPLVMRKGNKALQFSFVSKLVSIHDESQPIFDRYVQDYFGLGPPSLMTRPVFRISGFVRNLVEIGRRYGTWFADDNRFAPILRDLQKGIAGLEDCHPVRICDFLVWSVGKTCEDERSQRKQKAQVSLIVPV